MEEWKEKLKKIRPKLVTGKRITPTKQLTESSPTSHNRDDMAWKRDAKPLKRSLGGMVAKKLRRTHHKGKQPKKKLINPIDTSPSIKAIIHAYGPLKKKSNPVAVSNIKHERLFPVLDELPSVVLTQTSEFKEPETWVNDGAALYAPGGGVGQKLRVRLGIDFGTAYTKVALRVADKVFFVDWSGVRNSSEKFLLPGEVSLSDDGRFWLGRHPRASKTFGGLKNPFLSQDFSGPAYKSEGIAFLAWVIRYTRAWLYRTQLPLVQSRQLIWEINIGSPTDPWSSSEVRRRYQQLVHYAWQLSRMRDSLTLQVAEALLNDARGKIAAIGLDSLNVMPEFVAQVAGYVKSPQRQDGLHLLVDVGAGTVDVTAFNIYRPSSEEEDRYPIFEGIVEPLGTHVLMGARLALAESGSQQWADLNGIPSLDTISKNFSIEHSVLSEIDEKFAVRISEIIGHILYRTRTLRYPTADEWREGMRVFLAGGGSGCRVYQNGVERAFARLKTRPLFTTFPMLADAGKEIGQNLFHRISVAFGLTYDAESIGQIIRPKEIENMRLNTSIREQPDREELYPK